MRDFLCNLLANTNSGSFFDGNKYPLKYYLAYDSLSCSHKNFVLSISSEFEPQFYHQAVRFTPMRRGYES